MRRCDKEIIRQEEIEEIFRSGEACQLAFSADPAPYIVTLNYVYRDGVLYFHSAAEGRKIDLARKNSRAGFTVAINQGTIKSDLACNWSTRFQSIVGYGEIEFVETLEGKRRAFDLIMAHFSDKSYDIPEKSLKDTIVFKLLVAEMSAKQSPM